MEVNKINKELYESAFIENGEFGYHGATWKPDIDEREIQEYCGDCEGNYKPDGIWLSDLINWEGEYEPRINWERPVKWAYLKDILPKNEEI